MSYKINDYKKATRLLGVIIRAAERCFAKADVKDFEVSYSYGEYQVEFSADLFEYCYISADASNKRVRYALEKLVDDIQNEIKTAIQKLDREQGDYFRDIEEYGKSFHDSPVVNLSSLKLFQSIVNDIIIK